MLVYRNNLIKYARDLRKTMTEAEVFLWLHLRKKQVNGLQWYRQKVIGDYIVDFYCPVKKIVIEVDGSQHYSEEMLEADKKRDDYLNVKGIKVLRFNNYDVLTNIEGVYSKLSEYL
jgi:very-short-patch-repair endonuclease